MTYRCKQFTQTKIKHGHYNFPKPRGLSSICLICPTNSVKSKDNEFRNGFISWWGVRLLSCFGGTKLSNAVAWQHLVSRKNPLLVMTWLWWSEGILIRVQHCGRVLRVFVQHRGELVTAARCIINTVFPQMYHHSWQITGACHREHYNPRRASEVHMYREREHKFSLFATVEASGVKGSGVSLRG